MRIILRLEYFSLLLLGIYGYFKFDLDLIYLIIFFFSPDLSMIGYLINSKIGAYLYNFVHTYTLAVTLFLLGYEFKSELTLLISLILFCHISFDRVFGYGLKFTDAFNNTSLGRIGK